MSVESDLVELVCGYPVAGSDKEDFRLTMPKSLCDKSYAVLVEHIEFRRRMMNQGFDNLLELLKMHHEVNRKVASSTSGAAAREETDG